MKNFTKINLAFMAKKKHFALLCALLCASMMGWAINWDNYGWIGDGAGGGTYSNKYKLAPDGDQGLVNIQHPGFATADGIYTTFTGDILTCDLGAGNYDVQGGGMILHLTAFTAQETVVNVTTNGGGGKSYSFIVYYKDGTPAVADTEKPVMTSATCSSTTHNSATIAVAATDNVGVTKYVVKNGGSELGEYTPNAGVIVVEDLTASTNYTLTVFAKDAAGNVSASGIDVACNTTAAPTNPYCNLEIGHLADPSAAAGSFILLSVGSDGNGHTIVNIKQDNAKNSAMFDYINIVDKKSIGADVVEGGSDEMAIIFNTPTPDGDGNITFTLQWSTVNWGGRWQINNITVPADATCASADPFPGTNAYCKYTDNNLRSGGANVTLTWATNSDGDVVITLGDGEGASNTHFRNEGFEYGGGKTMDDCWFVYSGTKHSVVEPASTYFNAEVAVNGGNTYALRLKDGQSVPANATIAFFGHAFSWKNDQNTNAYTENKWFAYDYGYSCPFLAAPTNVAVDGTKHITFDGVANAQTYTASVYLNGILKHRQVVSSGDELTFQPYTTGTYQVQVVADASGYPTSDPSEAYDWALTAPSIVVGNSEYCEYAIGSGNQAAAITWETNDDGNIVITLKETLGGDEDATQFRGANGMALANFQVGAAKTGAGAYFNHTKSGKTITLSLKNSSIKPGLGEKIYYTDKVVEYVTSQNNNAYGYMTFEFTYGAKCSGQKHVTVSVNNNEMGSATVEGEAAVDVDEGTQVTCVATPAEGYEFVNWTVGGVEVATTATYQPTITAATSLVANFDYARTTYCHTAVQTSGNKKVYLTVGKGVTEGTYQIKIYGSAELTITGINNANTAINHVKYLTYDGNDVPLTIDNGGWTYSSEGYGVISSAELRPQTGYTWRDMWMWRPDLYMGTSAGQQVINDILDNEHYFNWDNTCADAEAPAFAKAEAEILTETSVRLKIQASDNWEGLLTYTIARADAEPIISNHASGEEFTQDVTGITTGTEYTFTVTVSDGVNNTNQNIVVTPIADAVKPVMGAASLESKTYKSAIINVAATDNKGVTAYYVVEKDADYVAAEGKITVEGLTAATEYTLHIKAKDAAGNISDNQAEVSFTTDAHALVPAVAAPVPSWPAAQVKSIYSDAYALAPANTPNYNAPWWGAPAINLADIDGDHFMDYNLANDGMIGWQYDQISVASMEKLHIDIYASAAGTVAIRPITEGGPVVRQTLTLAAQQWNSFDIELSEFGAHDWTKLFQFAIEYWNAGGLTGEHISVDNMYFYRTTALVDDEKPTTISGSVTKASFGAITLSVSGEDNSGTVLYSIKIGETEYANGAAASGASKSFTLNGLTPGTNYNISVIASDESGNEADPVIVVAQTNAITPAPVPARNAALVRSVYSDAYESALVHDFLKNTWTDIPYTELNISGDHVLAYINPSSPDQMPDIAWGENNDGANAIIAKDDFNDGTHKGLDVRAMNRIHFDIWSATATQYPELRLNDTQAGSIVLDGSGWQSFDLDISSLSDEQKTNIRWIKFIGLRDPAPEEIVIDNVYFYIQPVEISFGDDATDNTTTIADNANKFANVTINRNILADDTWYTLCLPFDMSAEKVSEVFGASTIATLESSEDRGSLIHLNFDYVNAIQAGKPYLIKPGRDFVSGTTISNVTIQNVNPSAEGYKAIATHMHFQGTFDKIMLEGEDKRYVSANNELYSPKPSGGSKIGAFRCYFTIPDGSSASAPGKQARIVFGPQNATGIDQIDDPSKANGKLLINGVLYIIRDGNTYNAQGMLIK